jgi:3-oxoadipate enol-lactonase
VAAIEKLIGGETRLPACYSRQNEACQQHDTVADLPRMAQPALVMAGDSDPICSLTATRMLGEGLPNVSTEIFTGASHFFLMEQPRKFMDLLTGWLQAH